MSSYFLVGDWRVIALVPVLVAAAGFFMVALVWVIADWIWDDGGRFSKVTVGGRHEHMADCFYARQRHPYRTCHGEMSWPGTGR